MNMYQHHAAPSLYKSSYASPEELRVLALEPNATKGLFVGDLSSFCTEKDLYAMYSPFGTILAIEIKRGRHGDSLLHGFVEYDSVVASFRAMEAFHGHKIMGRRMRYVLRLSPSSLASPCLTRLPAQRQLDQREGAAEARRDLDHGAGPFPLQKCNRHRRRCRLFTPPPL